MIHQIWIASHFHNQRRIDFFKDTIQSINNQTIKPNKVIVSFDYAEGLYFKDKKSNQFEAAGADGVFYPAEASIKNNEVILTSKKVASPAKVRFAWGNTMQSDLFNKANLPASCFTSEF